MSIAEISGSTTNPLTEILSKMQGQRTDGSSEDFAKSIISENDGDDDGQLTFDEAGINEDHFAMADADGDGFLTEEEIEADMENHKRRQGMMGELAMFMQNGEGTSIADSIIENMDTDADGLLTMEESGLTETLFGAMDSDGDGLISSEDITSTMEASMEADGAAPPPPPPMDSTSIEGAESVDSSSSSSEEEYDINDLNEDGVVTIDELRQAFASGDDSLSELFEGAEAEGYSTLMRMAMKAYQTQTGEVYSAMSETIA